MKKLLVCIYLLVSVALAVNAQEDTSFSGGHPKNIVGIEVGSTVSKITSLGVSSSHSQGLSIGVNEQVALSKSFSLYLETGLFFNQKGYKLCGFKDSETRLNYLELPVLVNYHTGKSRVFEVVPSAGGYIAVGLGGELKLADSSAIKVFKDETISRFDCGVQLGCKIYFWRVSLGFNYDFGLVEIDKQDPVFGETENKLGYRNLKNKSMNFRLGFSF